MISLKHIKLLLVLTLLPFKVWADSSVGTLEGQLSVNEIGAAVYSVPLKLFPSGTGFDPQIGVEYNSQLSGYGTVGYGVNITGLSSITRAGKDLFHDKKVEKIKYSKGDTYLLDGKRLYLKSGTYGYDNATYTVEGNPYVTVTQKGDDEHSTTSFICTDANGTTYEYTETQLVPIGDAVRTIAWYIKKATNKYGDCIDYNYMTDNKVLYPSEITYGRNGEKHKVSFVYAELSKAQKFHFAGGWEGYINRRLTRITSYNGNSVYRMYDFSYNTGGLLGSIFSGSIEGDVSIRKFDRLTTINVSNGNGESLKPISLNWNYLKSASIRDTTVYVRTTESTGASSRDDEGSSVYYAVDINNDGISDIIRLWHGQVWDYYSSNYKHAHGAAYLYISKSEIDSNGKVTYQRPIRCDVPIAQDFGEDFFMDVKSLPSGAIVCNIDGDCYNDLVLPYYNVWDKDKACISYIVRGRDINDGTDDFLNEYILNTYITKNDVIKPGFVTPLTSTDKMPLYYNADLNGDGKDDFIIVEQIKNKTGNYPTHIVSGADVKSSDVMTTNTDLNLRFSKDKEIKKMFLVDCNADGLQDLMLLFEDGYKIYFNNGGSNLSSLFTESNTKEMASSSTLKDYWRIEQGDFNGDGLADFVCIAKSEWYMYFLCNNGNGTFTLTNSDKVDYIDKNTGRDDNRFTVRVADFDKDGLSDVMVSKDDLEHHGGINRINYGKFTYKQTQIRWYRSEPELTSDGWRYRPVLWQSIDKRCREEDSNEGYIFSGDFNGDGYAEIANYGTLLNKPNDKTFTENNINIYSFSTDVALGHLESITNGFGKKTTIKYTSGTNPSVYTAGNPYNCSFPVKTHPLPLPLVSKVSQTNGAAGTQNVTYKYGDLRMHAQGRGILGFSSMTVNNTTLGSITETKVTEWDYQKNDQTDDYKYLPTSVLSTTTIAGKTSKTLVTNDIAIKPEWNDNFFSYCKEKLTTDFDDHQVKTQYTYDDTKGVLTNEISYYDGITDMYKQTSYSGYNLHAGKYLPNSVLYEQKHNDDSEIHKVRHNYTYEENGDIKEDVQTSMYKDQTVTLTTTYSRDNYGNVLTELTSGNNVVPVTKCYEYDTNHLRLVKSYTNPTSAVTTYKYDSWGNLITKSDESYAYNILSTTYTYDNWGRLIKTVNPDGTSTSATTTWDTTPTKDGSTYGSVYKTVTTATAQPPVTVYYDSEGREVNSSTIGLKGVNISKVTHYDSKGNVAHVVNTTGELEKTSVFSYDSFGRLTLQTNSDGSSIENSYDDRTVTIKDPTGTKTKTYDAWGNIKEVKDALGNILTYYYNSIGQPFEISANNSSSVTIDYDAAGRRINMKDPDAGEMKYSYAADGTILSQTDARGVTTNYSYDYLGRLKTKTYVDKSGNKKTQTNEYFPSGKDINRLRLQKDDSEGFKRTFTYDTYGRVTSETRYMRSWEGIGKDKRKSYTTRWKYNSLGQKETVTYPSFESGAMTFDYSYDEYGYLSEIRHGDKSLYSVKSYDGQKLETNTVAGVMSKNLDKDGYPSVYQLSDKDYQTFTFDKTTGNLESRKWTHGDTTMLDESFKYDNLDRLVDVSGTHTTMPYMVGKIYKPQQIVLDTPKMTIEYDNNGNILSKTGIGSYTYDDSKIHAVTSVSNDNNIAYNIHNKGVTTIFGLNGKIETIAGNAPYFRDYYYGPDDEKWETYEWEIWSANISNTLHLYFGDYERITEETGGFREYCFLENGIIFRRRTGNDNSVSIDYYQTVTDNLGSILAVYDQSGQEKFCAKYDAWGRQTVYTYDIDMRYGYTGHEMLHDYNLIDMGGRLYDPILGRFLSCDNYVQEPDNFQNFNRYSYCINNPLRYTDPSGELFGWDDVLVIAATFAINYVSTSVANKDWGWSSVGQAALNTACDYFTYGGSKPLAHIGKYAFNTAAQYFMPSWTMSSGDFSMTISPSLFWGKNGLAGGLNVSSNYRINKHWSVSIGGGIYNNHISAFAGARCDDFGISHGLTFYNATTYNGVKIGAQTVGTYSLMIDKFSLSVSNDNHVFTHRKFKGEDGNKHDYDRWRSSAVEMSIGDISIGTYVLNNDGYRDSNGKFTPDSFADSAWDNGQTYLAPIYFGYNDGCMTHRIGYSGKFVQQATQNFVHKHLVHCPRFEGYDNLYSGGFSQRCFQDNFNLWGF